MPHSDDESLSLLALGEPVADDVRLHVESCDRCAAHVRELVALVGVVRADLPRPAGVLPVPPPPQVWSGIAAETGVRIPPRPSEVRRRADALAAATRPEAAAPAAPPARPAPVAAPPPPPVPPVPEVPAEPVEPATPPRRPPARAPDPDATPPRGTVRPSPPPRPVESTASRTAEMLAEVAPAAPRRPEPQVAPPVVDDAPPRPPRAPRPPRRPGASGTAVFLVAAASLAIGVAAGYAVDRLSSDQGATPDDRQQVVASTTLDGLPAAPSAGGKAEVVQTGNGRRLEVDVSRLGSATGFYEVWLIDREVKRMVPVGILRGDRGEFVLPEGVDLEDYPVVDVSEEPLDGNPGHSGVSVLRGTIPT